jgi:N-acetylglucosaminyldiphosphoundecaprenol N-acetyl-beta-D-mannosaminyltransferase
MSPYPDGQLTQSSGLPEFPSVQITGVRVDAVNLDQLLKAIETLVKCGGKSMVANVNVHALNLSYRQAQFRAIFNQAVLIYCDGFGVKYAARWLGQDILTRITLAELMPELCRYYADKDISMYFIGAEPGVAQKAKNLLLARYPGLKVVGTQDGYFDKTRTSLENRQVLDDIRQANPDILVVGFGMPLQEKWIVENWDDLSFRVAFPVGAMFDYITEKVVRAPRWMTDNGLEWLGRLLIEPKRLWRRYLLGNPYFLFHLLLQKLGRLKLPEEGT